MRTIFDSETRNKNASVASLQAMTVTPGTCAVVLGLGLLLVWIGTASVSSSLHDRHEVSTVQVAQSSWRTLRVAQELGSMRPSSITMRPHCRSDSGLEVLRTGLPGVMLPSNNDWAGTQRNSVIYWTKTSTSSHPLMSLVNCRQSWWTGGQHCTCGLLC